MGFPLILIEMTKSLFQEFLLTEIRQTRLFSMKKNIVSFEPICLSKNKIFNNENEDNELSVTNKKQNFIGFESAISDFDGSKIKISFSLYQLNSDGNQ